MSETAEVLPFTGPAKKDLYEVGEIPPLGHIPARMYAWAIRRERHLTWEESGCYTLTLATSYLMLFGHRPHILRPGHNVLVWGASGGIGSMAVQLISTAGANAIGIISDDAKTEFVMQLGAKGVINRSNFNCWGPLPDVD